MVMLFEAALRHMRHAAALFDEKKPREALPLLTKASDIVAELAATLNPEHAPELAQQLGELYLFVAERLAVGAVSLDVNAVRQAERVFGPIVEGFQNAVASLGEAEARP